MSSFNKVVLMGTLGRDPEMKYTTGGTALTKFSIAINEKWKDKQSGQMKEEVHWVDITAWGKTAELAAEYLKKGRSVLLEGKLKQEKWETEAGEKRSKLSVTAENIRFLGGKQDGEGSTSPAEEEVSL